MDPLPRTLDPSGLDHSVNPGDDFYRFANGAWLAENPVPAEYGAWGAFHEVHTRNEALLRELCETAMAEADDPIRRMVGDYYASGIDEAQIDAVGLEPLVEWLGRISAAGTVDDFRLLAVDLHAVGVNIFFGGYVMPDFDDSDAYLLWLGQGGTGLPERDYYFRLDDRSVELREQYRRHIGNQLRSLGSADPAAAADAVLGFEISLAEASLTAVELRDIDRTINRHTMPQLLQLMPGFDLPAYLAASGIVVESVNINNPGFFSALDGLIASADPEALRMYCRWVLVRSTASSLPAAFSDEAFEFYGKALGGQQEQKPRWKRVLGAAGGDIGEQVSQVFIDSVFGADAKDRCDQLVRHLLEAMGDSIRGLEWMTEETKGAALEKLAGFGWKIGYPDVWRDYSDLLIDRGPWVANRLRAANFEHRRQLGKLGKLVDRGEWHIAPHVVNAYYSPLENEVVFPAGILQPPFFYAEGDDAINYGAIGSIIGHEITHGFDDKGSRFDASGRVRQWWTDADRAEFERRAAVIAEQYNGYEAAEGLFVNGDLTLGENIADLGGIRIAYRAFLKALGESGGVVAADGFTPHQRFFLSYATAWRQNATDEYVRFLVQSDVHSPHEFRCNGPLGNLATFADAFDLPVEASIMRAPEHRAEIW